MKLHPEAVAYCHEGRVRSNSLMFKQMLDLVFKVDNQREMKGFNVNLKTVNLKYWAFQPQIFEMFTIFSFCHLFNLTFSK